jgi:hypothetical protein
MRITVVSRLALIGAGLAVLAALPCVAATQIRPVSAARTQRFAALPDWTGIWETELSAAMASDEIGQLIARESKTPNRPEFYFAPAGTLQPFEVEFFRLMQLLQKPPYNVEWDSKYQAQVAELKSTPASAVVPGSVKACAWGFPTVMESPTDGIFEPLITPEETLLLFADAEVRHIYTDGRRHPKKEDLWPTEMGDSIGRWEGGVLVVDTIERKEGPLVPLPHFISPNFSEHAHFVERLRKDGPDSLRDDLTIEDPERLAHPWSLSLRFRRVTNMERLIATNCTENDRNAVVNGQVTITPR